MKKKIILASLLTLTTVGTIMGIACGSKVNADGEATAVNSLVTKYRHNGNYTKETNVYLTDLAVNELSQHGGFHQSSKLKRTTYYTPDALWMSQDEEGPGVKYSYYGTEGENLTYGVADTALVKPNVSIAATKTHKDWHNVKEDGMEGFYVTLKDIVVTDDQVWTVSNGVYSTENVDVINWFKAFCAPCYLGFTTETGNYIDLTSASIEEVDDTLVLSLYASNATETVLSGEKGLFATAVVSQRHSYSTISYVWSNDNSSVTATRTCTNSGCSYKEEETVGTTYAVTTPSTTEVQGVGTYTATFVNTIFTTQTKTIELDLIPTKTYYFDPGVWAENDATFGIKVWNSTSEKIFLPLTKGDSGLYEIECGVDMTNIMFVRYDSTSTIWWNDINNLTIPENKDMFVITSWESYLWDQYLTNDNASNFVAGETLYLQLNGDWGSAHTNFGLVCQFSGADGEGAIIPIEYVSGVIYKVTIPEGNYNCVRFAATSLDYSAIYNVTSYIYCDSDTTTNMLLLQSGWADMGGNWTIYTA